MRLERVAYQKGAPSESREIDRLMPSNCSSSAKLGGCQRLAQASRSCGHETSSSLVASARPMQSA